AWPRALRGRAAWSPGSRDRSCRRPALFRDVAPSSEEALDILILRFTADTYANHLRRNLIIDAHRAEDMAGSQRARRAGAARGDRDAHRIEADELRRGGRARHAIGADRRQPRRV